MTKNDEKAFASSLEYPSANYKGFALNGTKLSLCGHRRYKSSLGAHTCLISVMLSASTTK